MEDQTPFGVRVRRGQRVSAILLVTALGLPSVAFAGSLFFENFQSYADGSNLIGQGGWSGGTTGGINAMYVGIGQFLPGMVLDGRDWTGPLNNPLNPLNNIHYASHALSGALDPLATTVLSFDGYGTSTSPPSTNSGVGFGVGAQTNPAVTVPVYWDVQHGTGWGFAYMGTRIVVPDSYDRVVHLSIVIDGPAGEVYGLYDVGAGATATQHFTISSATIGSLDHASLFIDYQGEPTLLLFVGFGLVGLRAWNTSRR